jgi:pentatricopeptide repeat protein
MPLRKKQQKKQAETVFGLMTKDQIPMNTVLYTTMIKGYSREWKLNRAYELYKTILVEIKTQPAVAPNTITFNSLLD